MSLKKRVEYQDIEGGLDKTKVQFCWRPLVVCFVKNLRVMLNDVPETLVKESKKKNWIKKKHLFDFWEIDYTIFNTKATIFTSLVSVPKTLVNIFQNLIIF